MVLGFGKDGKKDEPSDNRSRSKKLEKSSAVRLGANLVAGSGSTPYAKGDFVDSNSKSPFGKGFCYQQKSSGNRRQGKPAVSINADLLLKTRKEAAFMDRSPVLEVIIEGEEPWYMVPLGTWQHLTGEKQI